MKRILILVCISALLFAGTAFAEPIKFPNGLTVDVAPGWSYEGEGDEIVLVAEDGSCAIGIIVTSAQGISSGKDAAIAMSQEHGGSEPQEIEEDTYFYTFLNEHGIESKVFVGIDEGKLNVISITGDHRDVDSILASID